MRIIYIGGYTKTEDSHFTHYKDFVQGLINKNKNILIVALAKEPKYFNERLEVLYTNVPPILDETSENNINWEKLDLIYIFGGTTQKLKDGLIKYGFSIEKLKDSCVILCDSAAANIMSKYYIGYDNNKNYIVEEGLNPKSNIFILCHADNTEKTPEKKIELAKTKSKELNSNLLLLNENDQRLYINNNLHNETSREEIIKYISK